MKKITAVLLALVMVLTASFGVMPVSAMGFEADLGKDAVGEAVAEALTEEVTEEVTEAVTETETETVLQPENVTEAPDLKVETEEESVRLAGGVVKVACVGDSITYGDKTTNSAYSYPSRLGKMLGSGYEVRNYGINGNTLTQSSWCNKYLNTSQSQACQQWQPDIIIVMLGTNDSQDICWKDTNGKGQFENDARELIQTYQALASQPEVFIATCPTADGKNQFLIKPDVIDNEIVPMQKKLAEELGCGLIDINQLTKNFQRDGLITLNYNGKPDLVHPNNDGYYQLAKFMFNGIASVTNLPKLDEKTYELDSSNGRIQYTSGWGDWSDSDLYMGTEKFVSAAGNSATLEFEGTGVQVTGIRTSHLTIMDVYIDGVYYQSSDTYLEGSSVKKHEPLFAVDNLPSGKHTIKVVLSDKLESYHLFGTKLSLDSFIIFQEPQGFVDKITFDTPYDEFTMEGNGDQLQVTAHILPENAKNKTVEYGIYPKGAADITKDGLITSRISAGSFYVTATAADGSFRSGRQEIKVGEQNTGSERNQFVDDRDASVIYQGNWTEKESTLAANGTLKETHAAGSTIEYTFTGTGIEVVGELNRLSTYSYARVEIDGQQAGAATFIHNMDDMGVISGEVLFETKDLPYGTHTIKLTLKNNDAGAPSAGQCGAVFDGFRIYDDSQELDLTMLEKEIFNAGVSLKSAVVGTENGTYRDEDKTSLEKAVSLAKEVLAKGKSQAELDQAAADLKSAIEEFAGSVNGVNIRRNVSVSAAANGTIILYDRNGNKIEPGTVENGTTLTAELIPDDNYKISSMIIGSSKKKISENAEQPFSIRITVNQDTNISADFNKIKIKIACVGDSITYGACSTAPKKNSYSANLQKVLGDDYEVQNFAMPSACLKYNGNFAYVNQSVFLKSKAFQPDIVIIMLGTNDSTAQNWDSSYNSTLFKADGKKLVETYRSLESNPQVYLATAPYTYDMGRQTRINNDIVPAQKELAKELDCPLIDMNKDTFELSKSFFYNDYLHFNDNGYLLMSQFILEGMELNKENIIIDKSELYKLYTHYGDIQSSECTPASWSVFKKAFDEAGKVLDNPSAKQSEITIASMQLKDSFSSLVFNKKIKLACVGDSITYGHNASPRESFSYPAQLQKLLGNQYEVRNFGVNGRTMNDTIGDRYVATGEYQQSQSFQPDVVIIMLGTNDSKNKNWNTATGSDTYTRSAKDLIRIYQGLASKPQIYIATSPSVAEDMSSSSDPEENKIWNWRIRDLIVPLQKSIAEEMGCKLIDVNKKTEALENLNDYLSSDLIHPHNAGYTLLASYMYEGITKVTSAFKGDLRSAVKTASEIDLSIYTTNSVSVFQTALKEAEALLNDESLTIEDQTLVNQAKVKLEAAKKALAQKADKQGLKKVIDRAEGLQKDLYTATTLEKVRLALEKAKKVYQNEELSINDQDSVDQTRKELETALSSLLKNADKTRIKNAVAQAEKVQTSLYTKNTVQVFEAALQKAKKLEADEMLSELDQNNINKAAAELETAQRGLIKIPAPVIKVSTVKLSPSSKTLVLGTSLRVSTSVKPSNAPNKKLRWTTSNKKIATVSTSGKVSAKGIGSVTITAYATDGSNKKGTLKIKVVPKAMKISKIKKKSSTSVVISWKRVSGVTGYQVQASLKKNSGYKTVARAKYKTTSADVKKLKKGRTYYYRIRSYKNIGKSTYYSSWSAPKSYRVR